MKTYYVYTLASKRNGTLYTGVTNDLYRRVLEHRSYAHQGFTQKYHIHSLVLFESTMDVEAAILREKQIKKWRRQWKIELIERENPDWLDLLEEIGG